MFKEIVSKFDENDKQMRDARRAPGVTVRVHAARPARRTRHRRRLVRRDGVWGCVAWGNRLQNIDSAWKSRRLFAELFFFPHFAGKNLQLLGDVLSASLSLNPVSFNFRDGHCP